MSILSRTLQTLLYKYLLDVDVEGVALPSLYENGWGVRLSNVKLREGIKLMDLPGTFPKKRDAKRKRPQKSSDASSTIPDKNSVNNTESEKNDHENPRFTAQNGISDVNVDPEDEIPAVQTSSSWFSRLYCRSTPLAVTVPSIPEPIEPSLHQSYQPDDLAGVAEVLPDDEEPSENSDHEAQPDPSPPVILRLGKDGHIGVLDVRLVGTSIRVLVEDASLTVEVIQARIDDEEDATETSTKAEVRKAPKDTKTPSTVGERVLAEIALARIFSAIPNLFLRDIRLRVIIRANATVASSSPQSEEVSEEIEPNDTVLDFAIELLSVTDGEDFLSNFRAAADVESVSDYDENEDHTESVTEEASDFFKSNPSRDNLNEFDVKRIRTGRGEEGGITLRVYSGSDMVNFDRRYTAPIWARQQFLSSSNYYALRLSGVDIESRVFLGENNDLAASGDVYTDDFRMDSMLFNIDFIAPASKKPLPPINSKREYLEEKDDQTWSLPGATTFAADMNGIQRCGLKSNFHRVSRGMVPVPCNSNHLPCEYCSKCWVECPSNPNSKHFLDNSLPMGGYVMHASIRDPLEINVDRRLLETIAILVKVFKKRPSLADVELETAESQACDKTDASEVSESWDIDNSKSFLTSLHDDKSRSRISTQWGTKEKSKGTRKDEDASTSSIQAVDESLKSSFPAYMQPEKIQILGLHLGEIKLRFHILRNEAPDRNSTFCYWDLNSKCFTADVQLLTASECPFQDTRIDIGQLTVIEHIGTQTKLLASFGTRHPEVDLDEMTVQTLLSKETDNLRPPWPSTAAILLDLPPPLETILYEARERHGLQLRLLKVDNPPQSSSGIPTSLNVALGSTAVDVPFGVQSTVSSVIKIAKDIVTGTSNEVDGKEGTPSAICATSSEERDSFVLYKLHASGGRVKMHPRIDVSLPLSTAFGEWSSLSGICLETVLNGAKIKYSNPTSSRRKDRGLSLQRLADLPEHVRLRVLLFLPDLKPMETALGMKAAPNSFMRCRAVNKGLVKVARRLMTNSLIEHEDEPSTTVSRRQELMEEFMKLGDSELEDLYRIYNRRLKQSRRNPTPRR
jgi:hypothetical protein